MRRARLADTIIMLLTIFGSILLLNLLIALMASTYENLKDRAKLEVNFARISHTLDLDNK